MGGQSHAPAALSKQTNLVPIVMEAGQDSRPIWTGTGNLATTEAQTTDRPARSYAILNIRQYRGKLQQDTSTQGPLVVNISLPGSDAV